MSYFFTAITNDPWLVFVATVILFAFSIFEARSLKHIWNEQRASFSYRRRALIAISVFSIMGVLLIIDSIIRDVQVPVPLTVLLLIAWIVGVIGIIVAYQNLHRKLEEKTKHHT